MEALNSKQVIDNVLGFVPKMSRNDAVHFKRMVGLTVDELRTEDKIRFFSLFQGESPYQSHVQNSILLGICTCVLQDQILADRTTKKIEERISQIYINKDTSDSMKRKIETLVASDAESNSRFFKDMSWFIPIVLSNGNIDIFSFTKDMVYWDNRNTKNRWLMTIARSVSFFDNYNDKISENGKEDKNE